MESDQGVSDELCEEVRRKFMQFLSEYTVTEDAAASQDADTPMTEGRAIYLEQLQVTSAEAKQPMGSDPVGVSNERSHGLRTLGMNKHSET